MLLIGSMIVLLLVASLVLLALIVRRQKPTDLAPLQVRFEQVERGHERVERSLRDEIGRNREEAGGAARELREEVASALRSLGETLVLHSGEAARAQRDQLELFAQRLDGFTTQLGKLTEANESRLETLREVVDGRLKQIQDNNTQQLEQMRATVDEKLQGTLEKRLGESFKLVSERLEQVHQGLGDMQKLAVGVGDLKRVLTNVKTRGGWGEVQLETLLGQILTPDQYVKNAKPHRDSDEIVEFAIRLPGRGDEHEVLLPIDAKFPLEDYQRLVAAQEAADPVATDQAAGQLETRIKSCAKDIATKYLNPPCTTDFGLMFLPTEGLYAEVIRRPGLVEQLQREHRVVVAGPTTLAALLNSLQMGFRTLAIQKRSSEVWSLLGAVKTEFGKFSGVLDAVRKKLDQASQTIDKAAQRSRVIGRTLRKVEELPVAESLALLPVDDLPAEGEDEVEALAIP